MAGVDWRYVQKDRRLLDGKRTVQFGLNYKQTLAVNVASAIPNRGSEYIQPVRGASLEIVEERAALQVILDLGPRVLAHCLK